MKQEKSTIFKSTTFMQRSRLRDTIERAKNMEDDIHRKKRIESHECKICFYGGRIGGAAMTVKPCASCGEEQNFGSTATDVLCKRCAKDHKLCKRCGSDIELRERRKDWPDFIK